MGVIVIFLFIINLGYTINASKDFCLLFNTSAAVKSLKHGYLLPNVLITRKTQISFSCCVKACSRMKRCESVNYYPPMKLCDVNRKSGMDNNQTLQAGKNLIHTSKDKWKGDVNCENEATLGSFVDCNVPEELNHAKADLSHGTGLYSKVIFKCLEGYVGLGKSYITCQDNETWSNTTFICVPEIVRCMKELKTCFIYQQPENSSTKISHQNRCQKYNGNLVRIDSEEKQNAVLKYLNVSKSYVPIINNQTYTWIQGERQSGKWRFDDDTLLNYTNWDDKQGNEREEETGIVLEKNGNYKWHDANPNTHLSVAAICEILMP